MSRPAKIGFLLLITWGLTVFSLPWGWGATRDGPSSSTGGQTSPSRTYPSPSLPGFGFRFGLPSNQPKTTPTESTRTKPPPADKVIVPDVRGKNRAQATAILAGARLRLGRVAQRLDNWPPGTILQQSPDPGTRVSPYSSVNVWIAEPPRVAKIRVPDLTGQSRDQAASSLARVKLQVGQVGQKIDRETPGRVIDQNPDPGTMVLPGTAVHFWVAAPPVERVRVPDLIGQTRPQANGALARVKLKMGRVARKASDEALGTVVDQKPKPGALVPPDFPVQVWLAAAPPPPPVPRTPTPSPPSTPTPPPVEVQGPPSLGGPPGLTEGIPAKPPLPKLVRKVRVPNLVGKKHHLARQLLKETGLQEGEVVTRKADLESDTIMVQTPEPGTLVLPGTPVVLVMAVRGPVRTAWPWGVMLAVLTILAGGYYVASRLMGKVPLPAIQVTPKTDTGIQHLALDTPLHLDMEVRLKPIVDPGQQQIAVSGPLILEEGEKS
jgi:beta-lactam-binding protein with PASTA domain